MSIPVDSLPLHGVLKSLGGGGSDGKRLDSVTAATNADDLPYYVTVAYDNGTAGVGATLTLTNTQGIALSSGDGVQIDNVFPEVGKRYAFLSGFSVEAGIYTCTADGSADNIAIFTRATDFDTVAKIIEGNYAFVTEGHTYRGTIITVDAWDTETPVIGTDDVPLYGVKLARDDLKNVDAENWHFALATVTLVLEDTDLSSATYDNGPLNDGYDATLTNGANGALIGVGFDYQQGSRVLVLSETNKTWNGIYELDIQGDASTPWTLVRANDFQRTAQMAPNAQFTVATGKYAGRTFIINYHDEDFPIEFGTTDIEFTLSPLGPTSAQATVISPDVSIFDTLPLSTYDNGASGVGATLTVSTSFNVSVNGFTLPFENFPPNSRCCIANGALLSGGSTNVVNGIYSKTSGTGVVPIVLTRTTDYDTSEKVQKGTFFYSASNSDSSRPTSSPRILVSNMNAGGVIGTDFLPFEYAEFSNKQSIPYEPVVGASGSPVEYTGAYTYVYSNGSSNDGVGATLTFTPSSTGVVNFNVDENEPIVNGRYAFLEGYNEAGGLYQCTTVGDVATLAPWVFTRTTELDTSLKVFGAVGRWFVIEQGPVYSGGIAVITNNTGFNIGVSDFPIKTQIINLGNILTEGDGIAIDYSNPREIVISATGGGGTNTQLEDVLFMLSPNDISDGITYNNGTSGVGATITSNVNGEYNIDYLNKRVGVALFTNTTTPTSVVNGIYKFTDAGSATTPWVLTRTSDFDGSQAIPEGATFRCLSQDSEGRVFMLSSANDSPIVFGTSEIQFVSDNAIEIQGGTTIQATYADQFGDDYDWQLQYVQLEVIPSGNKGQLQYNNDGVLGAIGDGTTGQVLKSNGAGAAPTWEDAGGGGTPAGTEGQIQINTSGAFGAVGSGTVNQVLLSGGSGFAPTWGSVPAPVVGTDTQVVFNDGGALAGNGLFVYTKATAKLSIGQLALTGAPTTGPMTLSTISSADLSISSGSGAMTVSGGVGGATFRAIGGDATLSSSTNVILSSGSGPTQRLKLTTGGSWLVNGTAGTAGQVLTTDSSGVPNWADLSAAFVDKGSIAGGTAQTFDFAADGKAQGSTITSSGATTITISGMGTSNYCELLIRATNWGLATISFATTINWKLPDGTTTTSISTYMTAIGRTTLLSAGVDFIYLWSVDSNIYGKLA